MDTAERLRGSIPLGASFLLEISQHVSLQQKQNRHKLQNISATRRGPVPTDIDPVLYDRQPPAG
jgi:hypothetical protein